ncbi:RecB family endonuclease NucS [Methanobacterium oryzae]
METKTIKNPQNRELYDFIDESLRKKAFLTLIAKCKIKYTGKTMNLRDILIMIKPDGSFIIHHEYDFKPVASLPSHSKFQTKIMDNKIVISTIKSNESLELEIIRAYLVSSY